MTDEAAYSELTDAADARPRGQGESEACLCVHWSWRWLTVILKPSGLPELQSLYLFSSSLTLKWPQQLGRLRGGYQVLTDDQGKRAIKGWGRSRPQMWSESLLMQFHSTNIHVSPIMCQILG